MQGIKISLSFAAFGFILSLLFGFTSHAAFFILIIRAVIIAVVFAGLGFGFYFIANTFIMDEADSIDVSEGAPVANPQVGTKVDLYVHDEELESDNDGNAYYVDDSSHQMLNNSDLRSTGSISRESAAASAPAAVESAAESQSPATQGSAAMAEANAVAAESAANFQTAETAQPESSGGGSGESVSSSDNAGSAASSNGEKPELDTLPDMSSFVMENNSSSEESENSAVESDSGYTTTVSSSHSDGSEYGVRDAEVMAKAISSVLSREES